MRLTDESLNVTETEGRLDVCIEMIGYTEVPLTVSLSLAQGTARGKNKNQTKLFEESYF